MNFLKFFLKDEVPAVGLSKFRDKNDNCSTKDTYTTGFRKQYFKPDYSNNFFLL